LTKTLYTSLNTNLRKGDKSPAVAKQYLDKMLDICYNVFNKKEVWGYVNVQ